MPTALIVDDDLGFVLWLGEIFLLAGCGSVPASSCRGAVSLIEVLDVKIDLIAVNAALSGVSEMVEALSRVHRPKVVVIREPNVEPGIHADATIDRPDMGTPLSRAEWAQGVRKLLKELIP